MLLQIIIGVLLFVLSLKYVMSGPSKKINGIYCQPGKFFCLKYWAFMIIMKLRQRQNQKESQDATSSAGYGKKSRDSVNEMDCLQKLPAVHSKAVDAVYFCGASRDGYYFVGATARRHNKLTQTILYIRIPDLGLLEIPSLPDTCLYRKNEMEYAADGFRIEPVIPMKEWKLSYSGQMRLVKTGDVEMVDVSFDLTWSAISRYFDFDTDLDPRAMCDAIARETWSREFFDTLKRAHQTHYEQFGEIAGTVKIDQYGEKDLRVQGVRDHSYGNMRDWANIHRYAIQYIQLEDGTSVCCGNICIPIMMSRLIIGYVFHQDGRCDPISSTDMELYKEGEDGNDPTDWSFCFVAGGKTYHTKCHVLDRPVFYMGYQWEGKLVERMCTFEVNGLEGWGISEWDYHNKSGRPEKYHKENEP